MQFVRTTEAAVAAAVETDSPEAGLTGSVLMVLARARSRIDPLLFLAFFTDPGDPGVVGLIEDKGGCCCC